MSGLSQDLERVKTLTISERPSPLKMLNGLTLVSGCGKTEVAIMAYQFYRFLTTLTSKHHLKTVQKKHTRLLLIR